MADPFDPKPESQSLPDFLLALQGDPWLELEWRRGLAAKAREHAKQSHGDSGGGRFAYRLSSRQRIRNAIRAPQAVVKIVRGGGAASGRDLESQLTYLSRNGELALDEFAADGSSFDVEGSSEIKGVSETWASRWDRAEALDGRAAKAKTKTYHLIVSFPEGTDEERARDAASTFADRFLTSGEFGDRWSHVRTWHTDRAHPHMHIVIDRRGESGVMMQINPARDISPARLRGLQVDAAAEHGLLLNDTPRVSRGLRDQGRSTFEWRAEQRGHEAGRNQNRLAYEKLTAGFAEEIIRHETAELRGLARTLEAGRTLAPETDEQPDQQQRFIAALEGAALALEHGKDLPPMDPQTLEKDRTTLDGLSAMSVDDLAETMRNAVREAEEIAPQLIDETQRAKLEIETGRIRELYAPYVPEFAAAGEQKEPYDGLGMVIDSRLGADQERERAPYEMDVDGYDNDLDPDPLPPIPSQTLSDADSRVVDAYTARGMNGERALARIKGGLEATQETRTYWHTQEIKERICAGDLSWSAAEYEVVDLHRYASGTYRAATRAISRGVSLDAAEVRTLKDPMFERDPEAEVDLDRTAPQLPPERDGLVERELDEPLVIFENTDTSDSKNSRRKAESEQPEDGERISSRDPASEYVPDADKTAKPSHEEFMRMIEEQERALLNKDAEKNRERGADRSRDIDDGFGIE